MAKFHKYDNGIYIFRCPGCGDIHQVTTKEAVNYRSHWEFNGDIDNPTVSPSLLVRSGHFIPGSEVDGCWCDYHKEHPEEKDNAPHCYRCHSFIRDGKIQFLTDCSHHLAGQTVILPDYEETDPS